MVKIGVFVCRECKRRRGNFYQTNVEPTILARRLLAAVMKLWRKSNLKGNSHYAKKNLTHRHDMEVFHGFVTRPWFRIEKPSQKNVRTIFNETINKNSIFFFICIRIEALTVVERIHKIVWDLLLTKISCRKVRQWNRTY